MQQLEKCREKNLSLYMTFFYFTKAFDTVNQEALRLHHEICHNPHLLHNDLKEVIMTQASENIDHFQYLRSVLLAKAAIDEEIHHCLQYASTAFGHLKKRVLKDNIRADTEFM
eukprot:g21610.t1